MPRPRSAAEACRKCSEQLIAIADWRAMSKPARQAARASGAQRIGGRGLCSRCYQAARQAGTVEAAPLLSAGTEPTTCCRCGITTLNVRRLCDDCADVLFDLGEAEAWA